MIIREIVGTDGRKFFGYARDITERKHNDEMLVQAKEEAEVATRAKARFLAFMTHEIRTSLNGMLGVVDLLGDTKLNSDQRQLIGVAEESGRSLIGIINDVLDFSKLEAGKFEIESNPFRLQLLLQSIRDLVEPQAEKKGLAFECNAPEELLQVYNGDADRIRQVLLNLIWNALKFTSDGKVSVNVNSTHRNKQPMLRFEVADTGIGIPDEKKQELFSEFSNINSTANNSSNSTGLGLAISKAFTLAMGGEIGFESAVQEGSVFWFEVPLELGEEKLLEQNSQIVFSPSFSGLTGSRILVADDNLTNQLIVKRYLRRAGAQVDIANNGKEAIAQFSKTRPDLVLMDISMPEMNGYEATAGIRYITNEGDHVPIIAFTAYAAEDDRKSIEAAGMDDHVTKPFSRDNLIATLLRHLPHLAADRQQDNGSANEGTDHVDRIAGELGLDSEILARTMVGLDEEAIGEVLTQFAADLARYCQLAQDGLQENDWGKVEKASHGMKGAAGMFGAIRLGEFSGTVNALCHDGAAKDIKHKTEQLVQEAQALLGNNRFESLVEELPSDSQKGSL